MATQPIVVVGPTIHPSLPNMGTSGGSPTQPSSTPAIPSTGGNTGEKKYSGDKVR